MKKREFLSQLEEKIKTVEIYQSEDIGDIDKLKEKLIPIIQKEFIESVPLRLERGNRIKITSKGFRLERELSGIYYIEINNEKIKIGNWCKGLSILQQELVDELSEMLQKNVKSSTDNDCLKFYCEYNKVPGIYTAIFDCDDE